MEIGGKWLELESFSGEKKYFSFTRIDSRKMKCEFQYGGYHFCICDTYREGREETILKREIEGQCFELEKKENGISFSDVFEFGNEKSRFRVGIPSCIYGEYVEQRNTSYHSFMEDRLTGPMITMFDEVCKEAITIQKINPSYLVEKENRDHGECEFLQRTDITSLGYGFYRRPYIKVCWPYEEKEKSVALNEKKSPVKAFYPLDGKEIHICLEYRMILKQYDSFTEALYSEYEKLFKIFEGKGEKVVSLPFSIEEEIKLVYGERAGLYIQSEWDEGTEIIVLIPEILKESKLALEEIQDKRQALKNCKIC